MTLALQIGERLMAAVPVLSGRVENAASFAAMTAAGELPDATPSAFVLPLGFDAQDPAVAAGLHVQDQVEQCGIILVCSYPGDALAAKALPEADLIAGEIVQALAGWVPEGAMAGLAIRRGRLIDVSAGTIFFQIDVSLEGQIRT